MALGKIVWGSVLLRVLAALVLAFATWNPDGWSYYHWAVEPLLERTGGFTAIKFLVGTLLLAGWVVFLQATRRSIGIGGALLVTAIFGGVIWLLISSGIVSANSGKGIARVVLFGLALVLAVGISWSHINRKITGQADTDIVT